VDEFGKETVDGINNRPILRVEKEDGGTLIFRGDVTADGGGNRWRKWEKVSDGRVHEGGSGRAAEP
jgi:hypothetical protein